MTDHDFDAAPEERPLSGTAVASLVFGLLLCIPGAGIPGVLNTAKVLEKVVPRPSATEHIALPEVAPRLHKVAV